MGAAPYHSLYFDSYRCNGCMICMRVCPTSAIRIRNGKAKMIDDRCIDCDECLRHCPQGAILPLTHSLDDLAKFDYKVAIPSPVIYAQFDRVENPKIVLSALRACGFDEVVPESESCEQVSYAISIFLSSYNGPFPVISSFCPAIVRLVQVNYPSLISQLLPILPPREVTAREAKKRASKRQNIPFDRVGAFYITPCSPKMVAIHDHPGMEHSYLDGAVAIRDLYHPILANLSNVDSNMPEFMESSAGIRWGFADLFPRSLPAENTLAVAGLQNVIHILDDIEKGRLQRYAFVECHCCPKGCINGTLTVANPYVARTRLLELTKKITNNIINDYQKIESLYHQNYFSCSAPFRAKPPKPMDTDVTQAIIKMKKRDEVFSELRGIDCGACGSPSCRIFAEDVVMGEVEITQCPFIREKEVALLVRRLYELVVENKFKDMNVGESKHDY